MQGGSLGDERAARSPALGTGQKRQGDGERPSASLRRLIDDIESGRMETTDYPSSKEYLVHLDAVLDE